MHKEFIKRNMEEAESEARAEAEAAGVMPSAVMYSAPEGYATGEGVEEYEEPTRLVHAVTGSTPHAEDGHEHELVEDPEEFFKGVNRDSKESEERRLFNETNRRTVVETAEDSEADSEDDADDVYEVEAVESEGFFVDDDEEVVLSNTTDEA
jgi:hypothetical protein